MEGKNMTTEKMSVHRVLAELKTLDSRIETAINRATYVMAVKQSAEKINGMTVADFKNDIKNNYQKVRDLIKRRDAMKRAVVLSNATTKVQIGDTEYTVAEAIDAKNHSMELKQTLLNMMVYQYNKAQNELTRHTGEALEKDAERHVKEVLAASIKEGNAASVANLAQVIREEYLKNNTWDMIDPLGVAQEIEALNDEISKFNADVDAALSTSNAVTIVEFSY
jgi:hypothetical protein